jgi:hypothetical protein
MHEVTKSMRTHRAFLASIDEFRCMVGPGFCHANTPFRISAKADKSSLTYDQWSEM